MIDVVVGLLEDARGHILVGRRRAGTHMAGRWEFPGGKRYRGETAIDALQRELREELGIDVLDASRLLTLEHDYADRSVRLDTWLVERYRGRPRSAEGQDLRWVAPDRMADVDLLEADAPIVAAVIARRGPAA